MCIRDRLKTTPEIHLLIYGEGKKILNSWSFIYECLPEAAGYRFFYFGDLDPEGVGTVSYTHLVVCGILDDHDAVRERKLEKLVCLLKNDQPGEKADYRSWQRTALRLAETRKLLASLEHLLAPERILQIQNLLQSVSDSFINWYERKQGTLASLFLVSHPDVYKRQPGEGLGDGVR